MNNKNIPSGEIKEGIILADSNPSSSHEVAELKNKIFLCEIYRGQIQSLWQAAINILE